MTANEIVLGFLLAASIGVPLGLMIVSVKFLERSLYPLILFLPADSRRSPSRRLFIVWFGFGPFPKILLTFLLVLLSRRWSRA